MIKFIDLFSGLGGFRIAFESHKCKCVFSSEIDKHARGTYLKNFNEYPSGDITEILSKDIPDHDILCAGFPCQAFSIAGKRRGFDDARGTLFFEVARIMKEKQPKIVLLENVKGITNHDKGNTLNIILQTINELGYKYKNIVLNSKDFGLPQSRERWYCVCYRSDLEDEFEKFSFPEKKIQKNNIETFIEHNVVGYNISDVCKKNIEKFIELKKIECTPNTLAYEIRPSRCQFKVDGTAPTLTAKMGTGGNNVPVLVSQMRKLTERECLNLMGYPLTYKYNLGFQTYKQIGNSVCVPVISSIAKKIIDTIKK